MRGMKRRKKYTKLTYHVPRKKDIMGHADAAQLQHRGTYAVMITADNDFTFWDTPTLRSYSVGAPTLSRISPKLYCLLTQLVGMVSKSIKAAENVCG
jgi:hypothetical protein